MQIYEALKQDHDKVRELLDILLALDDDDTEGRTDLVQDIRDALIPHARAEESVFYNSLRALHQGDDLVMHGYREHMEAEGLLRALQVQETLAMDWKATARKLKDALEHHIAEEENRIFAAAARVFTQEEARELGKLFVDLKAQVEDEGFLKNSLDFVANLMPPRITTALKNLGNADRPQAS